MTIDPKDLRTLLLRVTAVTLAVRLVPLIGQDLGVHEAAIALGLGDAGHEPVSLWTRGLWLAGGGFGAFARLVPLFAEAVTPALAVLAARAAGWGAMPGLMAGLLLAMGPLGLDMGARADGVALGSVAALAALGLLRGGLQAGDPKRTALSAVPLLVVGPAVPGLLLLVPSAIYLLVTAIADDRPKRAGLIAWQIAMAATIGVRLGVFGHLLPRPTVSADWWLGTATMDPSGWTTTAPWQAALEALGTVLPSGSSGALVRQLDMQPVALPVIGLGAVLTLLAVTGLARGRVMPDPVAPGTPALDDSGAGAADGWRTLGVRVSAPRALGGRDIVPLVLPVLFAVAWIGWQARAGAVTGLVDVLAVARPCAAMLVGVGLTAWAMPRNQQERTEHGRRAAWQLAIAAMLIFAMGAQHLLEQNRRPEGQSARKVARFARDQLGPDKGNGAVLALGARGLPVVALLDPYLVSKRLRWVPDDAAEALSALTTLLADKPDAVVLVGDRDAVGPMDETVTQADDVAMVWQMLFPTLQASGWQVNEESHRYLGHTGVLAFMPVDVSPTVGLVR